MINNKRCILVVDDEIKLLRALKDLLAANNFHILTAKDGEEALDVYYANSTEIDLIILDVMMPKYNGFEVLEEIRNNCSLTPVILLTAKCTEYDQLAGFNAGADDYIQKPFSPSILLARTEAVLKRVGKGVISEICLGALKINQAKREVTLNDEVIEFTKREFDLLYFLMSNPSLTFTREHLLNSVWGYEYDGDIRTIDTHIKQLRMKMRDHGSYIKTVHKIGYRLEV